MKLKLTFAATVVALLAGCSTPPYECALSSSPNGRCASTADAYKAAHAINAKDTRGMTSVFDKPQPKQAPSAANERPYVGAQASEYPSAGANGAPVFEQPKVFRPWLAPYVDAEGNLRSGEYGYFSTPGRWNYGTLRQPGAAAAAIQGPARPDNLGFNPVVKSTAKPANAPARPDESRTNANAPSAAVPAEKRPVETKVGDITQPYQRITE